MRRVQPDTASRSHGSNDVFCQEEGEDLNPEGRQGERLNSARKRCLTIAERCKKREPFHWAWKQIAVQNGIRHSGKKKRGGRNMQRGKEAQLTERARGCAFSEANGGKADYKAFIGDRVGNVGRESKI